MYTIVTSLNQKYWDETSKINIQSWAQFLPQEVKIVIYSYYREQFNEIDIEKRFQIEDVLIKKIKLD